MGDIFKQPVTYILMPVVAYLCGWAYLRAYFDQFDINLLSISVPYEHYLVWGAVVFASLVAPDALDPQNIIFILALFALLVLAFVKLGKLEQLRTGFIIGTVIVLVVFGGIGATAVGLSDAQQLREPVQLVMRAQDRQAAAEVAPVAVDAVASAPQHAADTFAVFVQRNSDRQLQLVWQDEEFTIVAHRSADCADRLLKQAAAQRREARDPTPEEQVAERACRWTVYRVRTEAISLTLTQDA